MSGGGTVECDVRRIEWALLAIASATTCALGGTPALAWSSAGAAVCLLAALAGFRGDSSGLGWFLRAPALLLGYALLRIPWSAVPARSVYWIALWASYVAAASVAFLCERRNGAGVLRFGLIGLAAFEAAYGLFQYLTGHQQIFWFAKTKYLEDATGTFLNHSHFAGLLTLALGPTLAAAVTRKSAGGLYWLAAALLLLAAVFSRSRAGIVCALAAALACGAYLAVVTQRRQVVFVAALLLFATAAYGAWIGLDPVAHRFLFFDRPGYLDEEGRLTLWRDTWQLVKLRPWLGWGPGTFPAVYPLARTEPSDLRWMEAHNDYLQIWCELGLVGAAMLFVPWWSLIGLLLRNSWRARDAWGGAMALSLAAVLAHSAVDFHLQVPANALWLAIVTGVAAGRCLRLKKAMLD